PLQRRHGQALAAVIRKVSELAADIAKAPLLSLQSPVQLPPKDDQEEMPPDTRPRTWPRSSAIAVRFAIALSTPTAEKRLELIEAASRFCAENGFAFWVSD